MHACGSVGGVRYTNPSHILVLDQPWDDDKHSHTHTPMSVFTHTPIFVLKCTQISISAHTPISNIFAYKHSMHRTHHHTMLPPTTHTDPHPGNLLRLPNGKLAYLDFGMMGSVDPSIRRGLIRATLHLTNREYAALADDFITLGFLPTGSNKAEIVPALTGVRCVLSCLVVLGGGVGCVCVGGGCVCRGKV